MGEVSEVERLAEVLSQRDPCDHETAMRRDEYTYVPCWECVARDILASPWLAAHVAQAEQRGAERALLVIDAFAASEAERLNWRGEIGMLGNWVGGIKAAAEEVRAGGLAQRGEGQP